MKDGESSSKAAKGRKTKETEHLISRCQIFAHLISRCENFAHPIPRCEILGPKEEDFAHPYLKVRNPFSRCEFPKIQFRTPLWKVRKFSHGAKSSPGTRVQISHTSSSFSHGAKQCAKISHTTIQGAKISHGKILSSKNLKRTFKLKFYPRNCA